MVAGAALCRWAGTCVLKLPTSKTRYYEGFGSGFSCVVCGLKVGSAVSYMSWMQETLRMHEKHPASIWRAG